MTGRRGWMMLVALGLALGAARCDCNGGGEDAGGSDATERDAGRRDTSSPDLVGSDLTGQDLIGVDAGPGTDAAGTDAAGTDAAGTDAAGTDAAGTDGGGGNDAGQATVTETCSGAPTTAVAAGSCEVQNASGTGLLIVGTVLTPGRVYAPGGVLLDATGTITCAGCDCFTQGAAARMVVCNGAVISPGLINTHDHIGWMGDVPRPNMPTPDVRYEHRHDWRKGDPDDGEGKISTSGGASNDTKAMGELRFILGGATSVNGSGTAPGLMRNLDKASGLEGLSASAVLYETFPLGDSNGTTISSSCNYPDYVNAGTAPSAAAYTPHVSEGINAFARNEALCLSSTDRGGMDLLGSNTAIIHGIGLSASDVEALVNDGVKLIWSARTNVTLYGDTAQVTLWHRLGGIIGLGTDWIPSGSMNMLRELACIEYLNRVHFGGYFSFEQLWRMATYDAARSLSMGNVLGILAAGHAGDIAIFRDHATDPFESVVKAEVDDVLLVLRGGEVLAGRSSVVAALEANCDELEVCGVTQRVCLQREIGKTLSQLESAASDRYALFFCDTPDAEPSCVPYRGAGESEAGSTTYPQGVRPGVDDDGDGIENGQDNCPNVFNPVRPVDGARQGNVDGDALGDVCDPCPFDANTTTCTPFNPDDLDRDGVDDLVDNCPGVPNPAPQADTDSDDKGDACDPCPDEPNPGSAGCTFDISEIQTDLVPEGTRVRVSCAVTGVGAKGFFCQDRAGGPHSGIYVYTNAEPLIAGQPLVEGDDLQVDGVYDDYYGLAELASPTLTRTGNGGALAPAVLPAADLATGGAQAEAYESVLVRVNDVTVTVQNADGSGDYDEFVVTGGLRVDDLLYPELDNTFAVGTAFSAIVGPLYYSYSNTKLVPRREADLQTGPARLAGFSAALAYQRVTATALPTLPHELYLTMTRAVDAATDIALGATPAGLVEVPALVTVPMGSDRVLVPVRGLSASSTLAHLTATLSTDTAEADVRVLADDQPAAVVAIAPLAVTVPTGRAQVYTVQLDLPAPVSGALVHLDVLADDVVIPGTAPASLTIPFNALDGEFTFVAGNEPASGRIEAAVGSDTPVSASVDVIDLSSLAIDLSGWRVVQANSSLTYTIPAGTQLALGEYLIIGRSATRPQFESFWGVTLGAEVHYLNGKEVLTADGFPVLNGGETYAVFSADGDTALDGPSMALAGTGRCHQRKVPVQEASLSDAWNVVAFDAATPGAGQTLGASPSGAYVSEFCDPTGTGNYVYEYVELYYDGTP